MITKNIITQNANTWDTVTLKREGRASGKRQSAFVKVFYGAETHLWSIHSPPFMVVVNMNISHND